MKRKEAIDVIKKNWPDSSFTMLREALETLVPELSESEDERIRKALINGFNKLDKSAVWYNGITNIQILDWLEKQGEINKEWSEMKVANIHKELQEMVELKQKTEQGEQKPAELIKEYDFHGIKFIPKFAKGDIIKDKKCGEVSTIEDFSYDTGLYTYTYGQFPITIQDNYEIIEQKPAECLDIDAIKEELEKAVKIYKPSGDFGWGTLYNVVTHFVEWEKKEIAKENMLLPFREYDNLMDSINRQKKEGYETGYKQGKKDAQQWKPSEEQMWALSTLANIPESASDACKKTAQELLEQLKKLREE